MSKLTGDQNLHLQMFPETKHHHNYLLLSTYYRPVLYITPSKLPSNKGISSHRTDDKRDKGCSRLYTKSQIPESKAVIPKGHEQFPNNILIF